MNDEQKKDAIRDFLKVWVAGDTQKPLALFTEESTWIAPQGTFKGLKQIEIYLKWVYNASREYQVTETGIGIIVQGEVAVTEHVLSGIYGDIKWASPAVCIYEFEDDKIINIRTYTDVLDQARQLAKGPVEKMAVGSIIKASRAGLENK